MRNSIGSSGFWVDHSFSGPIGTIEPARTNKGSLSIGAAASMVRGPSTELPVQKSYHFDLGRYTRRELTPGSVTGFTRSAGPYRNWSPMVAECASVRKSIINPRIGVYPWLVVIQAIE